jgi:fructokinase
VRGPKVVSIGELLFDVFPDGERLGGAPSNFAYHTATLGGNAHLISAVGDDGRGSEALRRLGAAGVNVDGVRSVSEKQTGVVSVALDESGQPTYDIIEDVAWDQIEISPSIETIVRDARAICWGTLGQRSCRSQSAHRQLFDFVPDDCLRVCDINVRQQYHSIEVVTESLNHADLLKLNDEEVPVLRSYIGGSNDSRAFVRELRHRFNITTVVLTMGADGCRVFANDVDFKEPGVPVDVVNTVGSGDAFTAAFVLQVLGGADLKSCAQHSNRVGAYVATQDSGMPDLPDHFRQ